MAGKLDDPKWEPHSIDSEQQLLGAIMLNNDAYPVVSDFLTPEHFFEPLHAHIFEVMGQLIGMGKVASPVTLKVFIAEGLIAEGMTVSKYLARLAAEATTIINARDFAMNIRDLAFQRRMMMVGAELERPVPVDVYQAASDAIDTLDTIIAEGSQADAKPMSIGEAVAEAVSGAAAAFQGGGQLVGLSYGLKDLDRKTSGLHPGNLIVLAGRPGMGKTAIAISIARKLGEAGHPGIFFSAEMEAKQLGYRFVSDDLYDTAPIKYSDMLAGRFEEPKFEKMKEAERRLDAMPIKIEQKSAPTVSQIAAKARRAKRVGGLKWLVIDYLQLLKPSGRYHGNIVMEIGEITASLKSLAKELGIPIILLSQLNRAVEAREDKRPNLSDLRFSGNIEQDADVVIMLYREAYYVERQMPNARPDSEEFASWQIKMQRCQNLLDVLIEKQRQGPVGTVRFHCNIACNAVRDMAQPDERAL